MVIPLIAEKQIKKKEEKKELKKEEKKVPKITIPLIEAEEIVPEKISKEPIGARPIIPKGNTCCVGVCTHLNKEIDTMNRTLRVSEDELKYITTGPERIKARRGITALTNRVSSLKDIRLTLAEKNICGCVEIPKITEKTIPKK